ncbi:HAMP domain-containing sensor histidine kinase [uncultured Deinococcus sp.]|uniref:sensor histidine kinase n=1 Tax=uncultured Deinococcus sp. TaxID=158789 RepID=UPI00258C1567|nr:HAMP domain-containing sensor histidine kinase [uncultured Deinococcus sp.]
MTIRTRLALGVALQTAIVVLVVAAVQFLALRSFLVTAEYQRLTTLLPVLAQEVGRSRPAPGDPPLPITALPRNVDARVVLGGRVVAVTEEFPGLPTDLPTGYAPRSNHQVLVAPVSVGGQLAQAQIASDVLGIVDPLQAYLRALAVTVPAAAALVAFLSFLLAGRLLRPLARLQEAAARLEQGRNLRRPLPGVERNDELGRLAGTLQASFAQLAEVREREEEFTRAAAHDLRSPLAALKIRLQGSLSGRRDPAELRHDMREALVDVDRMQRLTEHLLLLARGTQPVRRIPVDLARLTGETVDRARETAPDIKLDFRTSGETTLLGDEVLLTRLVENLIGNALHHGRGADVSAEVTGGPAEVRLVVRDTGPGVPESQLPYLTQAFYQVDQTRSDEGNGLGLAIVQRAAELHGGGVRFGANRPTGLVVTVTLPRSP